MSTTTSPHRFRAREFKGSRLRCLIATGLERRDAAAFLNQLVMPYASVTADDSWAPCGFGRPVEVCLGDAMTVLNDDRRATLTDWWLAAKGRANTPNWDIVSTCHVGTREGLVLVEAKAHARELHDDGLSAINTENRDRIGQAIEEASDALGGATNGWQLSAERCYQLSNRSAWSWKLASLRVPVVLVYLGFLDAYEMSSRVLTSPEDWDACVRKHANGVVPNHVWDSIIDVGGTSLVAVIRAARVAPVIRPNTRRAGPDAQGMVPS
jgi:hypothetical protein